MWSWWNIRHEFLAGWVSALRLRNGSSTRPISVHFRSILAAACEKKTLLFMDPLTRSIIRSVEHVHSDCVNSVKYVTVGSFSVMILQPNILLSDSWIADSSPRAPTITRLNYGTFDGSKNTNRFEYFAATPTGSRTSNTLLMKASC